ncbi:hypothetical protein Mapa_013760 [Marchantia paleacea]|nr:hypothetical protein Mapa_013760 [Marchantia paleacea]
MKPVANTASDMWSSPARTKQGPSEGLGWGWVRTGRNGTQRDGTTERGEPGRGQGRQNERPERQRRPRELKASSVNLIWRMTRVRGH